ncbi:hypothetical protein Pelo_7575 [Pelomyxa schiedti]|nr:hypothetical protein Pelo_7575 [Pelomyxa schiedti]
MAPPGAAGALATSGCLIARLLWSFVTDTATDFVFGEWFTPSGWPRSRLHAFSVSAVLLGLTRDPQLVGPGKSTPGRGAVAWLGGSRWVEEVRSLDPPPPYLHQWFLCDSAGEERCLAERRPGFRRVPSAANHMWFVITTCDGVDGGGECTGTIGVVIMSLIGGDDPKADVSGVAVQIKELLWAFVTETATNLVFGELFDPSGRPRARPHAFSVSPLLQSLMMGPRPHPQGGVGMAGAATWWDSPTRWVDLLHSLHPSGCRWVLHDNNEGRGGGGCLLWAARDGLLGCYAACDVNGRWFVANADGENGDGDGATVRDRCGGMVGVVIVSVVGEADKPDPDRVVVPISGECCADDYYVKLLSFSRYHSNEMLAVVLRKNRESGIVSRNDPIETRWILFDVESAYNCKSPVIVSDTKFRFTEHTDLLSVLPLQRKSGSHCFIVLGRVYSSKARSGISQVIEVEETTGTTKVLSEGDQRIISLYRVSDSQFCLSFNGGGSLYQIWDCSGAVTSMVMSAPDKRDPGLFNYYCGVAAESGSIFTVGEHQNVP